MGDVELVEAINAPGNGEPMSLVPIAEGNPEVQATLRKHGARG